jgi:hypothetical protein
VTAPIALENSFLDLTTTTIAEDQRTGVQINFACACAGKTAEITLSSS